MIDNEFILETSLKFDIPYLLNLVTCSIKHKDIKRHQRLVKDDPYLSYINSQIPELTPRWNFYNLAPYSNIPPHVDAMRNCALNIPLQGTANSKTLFYKPVNSENLVYDDERVLHWTKTKLETMYEFSLLKPTLIKNDIPHSVTNGPHRRIILSWSINVDISFEQARLIFKDKAIDFSQHSC